MPRMPRPAEGPVVYGDGLMAAACSHLDQVTVTELPEPIRGCEDCLAIGSTWVHLRMCLSCGKIGCCDSSPNRHARRHAGEADHPIARSAEPGEEWAWCFVDDVWLGLDPGTAA